MLQACEKVSILAATSDSIAHSNDVAIKIIIYNSQFYTFTINLVFVSILMYYDSQKIIPPKTKQTKLVQGQITISMYPTSESTN
jgi:hypothetical protein